MSGSKRRRAEAAGRPVRGRPRHRTRPAPWRAWGPVAVAVAAAVVWLVAPAVGAPWWSPLAGRHAAAPAGAGPGDPAAQARAAPEPVQSFPFEGFEHVPLGTSIAYRTDPPTSGPHYDMVAQPGFYEDRTPAPGLLVHNLEHGHVVIYYSRGLLGTEARSYLQELTQRYRGTWDAVLAVPRDDDRYELILTAWQHMQRLPAFERQAVDAFVDRFRGRGPEHPVR